LEQNSLKSQESVKSAYKKVTTRRNNNIENIMFNIPNNIYVRPRKLDTNIIKCTKRRIYSKQSIYILLATLQLGIIKTANRAVHC